MNKRHYEHTLPNIRGSLSNTYDEAELRTGMERLQEKTRLDDYFVFGYGKHHLWVCQRRPSNQKKIFEHRVIMAEF